MLEHLLVNDDIEFMTKEQWDALLPHQGLILVTPDIQQQLMDVQIERERQLAASMQLWADDYEREMEPHRNNWLNEVWNK